MPEENQIQKKKSNAWLFIVLAVAVIGIVVVVLLMSAKGNDKLSKQLELAHQYLMEMDYEQAIAAYEEAIKIDPKSTDAYLGLAEVYVSMAEVADVIDDKADNYQKAIDVLDRGYSETGSDVILERKNEIEGILESLQSSEEPEGLEDKEEENTIDTNEEVLEQEGNIDEEEIEDIEEEKEEPEEQNEEVAVEDNIPVVVGDDKYVDPDGDVWTKEDVVRMWNNDCVTVKCPGCGNIVDYNLIPIEESQIGTILGYDNVRVYSDRNVSTEGLLNVHYHTCKNCGMIGHGFRTDDINKIILCDGGDCSIYSWADSRSKYHYMYDWILSLNIL